MIYFPGCIQTSALRLGLVWTRFSRALQGAPDHSQSGAMRKYRRYSHRWVVSQERCHRVQSVAGNRSRVRASRVFLERLGLLVIQKQPGKRGIASRHPAFPRPTIAEALCEIHFDVAQSIQTGIHHWPVFRGHKIRVSRHGIPTRDGNQY